MKTNLTYNKEINVLYITVEGSFSLAEYEEIISSIVSSSDYPSDVNTLWDLNKLDFKPITSDTEHRVISIREKYPERSKARVALFASSDASFGMSRMYETLSSEMPQLIQVFRELSDAEKWLKDEKQI